MAITDEATIDYVREPAVPAEVIVSDSAIEVAVGSRLTTESPSLDEAAEITLVVGDRPQAEIALRTLAATVTLASRSE